MKSPYTIQKPECEWGGLTLDEIRYARALTETRIMISKEVLASRTESVFSGKAINSNARTIMGRMLGALSWLDYGLIALRMSSKLSGILSRRKRNK